jgi:hypothetical protein
MDGASVDHRTPTEGSGNEGNRARRDRAATRDRAQHVSLDEIDDGVVGLAEPRRARCDRVEHGLNVGR